MGQSLSTSSLEKKEGVFACTRYSKDKWTALVAASAGENPLCPVCPVCPEQKVCPKEKECPMQRCSKCPIVKECPPAQECPTTSTTSYSSGLMYISTSNSTSAYTSLVTTETSPNVMAGTMYTLSLNPISSYTVYKTYIHVVAWGLFKAPVSGVYTFQAKVSGGIQMSLNNTDVINIPFASNLEYKKGGSVTLYKDMYYPIQLRVSNGVIAGDIADIQYSVDDSTAFKTVDSELYHYGAVVSEGFRMADDDLILRLFLAALIIAAWCCWRKK